MAALTKPQESLLAYLAGEPDGRGACERVCHPNTAAALERRGLLTVEDGNGDFRPWFDCKITEAGRAAISPPAKDHPNDHPYPQTRHRRAGEGGGGGAGQASTPPVVGMDLVQLPPHQKATPEGIALAKLLRLAD